MTKNYFIDPEQFGDMVKDYYAGKDNIEEISKQFLLIAQRAVSHPRWIGYCHDMKNDLVSAAVMKMLSALTGGNMKRSRKIFNYCTAITFNAFKDHMMMHHYKQEYIKGKVLSEEGNDVFTETTGYKAFVNGYVKKYGIKSEKVD